MNAEIEQCRAMQRWAATEVAPTNNQRSICIGDWFGEEFLILSQSSTEPSRTSAALAETSTSNTTSAQTES